MRKMISLLGLLLLLSGGIANAYSINYNSASGNGGLTSPYAGVTVETFDNAATLWNWGGDGTIATASVANQCAAPFQDQTKFVTVPNSQSSGSYTATNLGGTYNYLGLWWGSVDAYNTLSFYNNGTLVATIQGMDVAPPANGAQTDPTTNVYVNFLNLPLFDSFTMTSTQYAFEADNIAVGVVPEPGTFVLFGAGLLGLALYRKRRA